MRTRESNVVPIRQDAPDLTLERPPSRWERAEDPFDGLPHLAEVALRGAQILAVRDEPLEWVWRGIMTADHHVEISGPSYSGKTTLMMLLAVALANPTGEAVEVLGRVVTPVAEGKYVVVVEEENSRRSARLKLIDACEMLGLDAEATFDRVILLVRADVVAHLETRATHHTSRWSNVLTLGERGCVGAILIDSRARVLRDGESRDEGAQARAQEVIHQAIGFCACPVVVVSHTRKSGAESIEDLAGSHQRGAGADTILLVTAEREDGRVLASKVVFAKLRDGEDEHPAPATFSIAKDEAGRWRLATNASARAEDQPVHERVLALLRREGAKTKNEIRSALKLSGERVETAISTLFSERQITKKKSEVRGKPCVVFAAKAATGETFADRRARRLAGEERPEGAEDESAARTGVGPDESIY